jgi:hypothetical protein
MALPGYDTSKTRYPGIARTSAGLGGDIPQQNLTGWTAAFHKRLYKSPREVALLLDKTFKAGYGCLEIGTVLAEDQNSGNLVPYAPDTISEEDVARVFLLNDVSSPFTSFDVDLLESYKLASGETIIITDTDGSYSQTAITGIDRTSSPRKATVTVNEVSASFSVSKLANAYVKAEDAASGKRSKAKYILDMTVDTGAGADAEGGLGAVLLSNAIVYKEDVPNMDSAAMTNLGNVSEDGGYYVVK